VTAREPSAVEVITDALVMSPLSDTGGTVLAPFSRAAAEVLAALKAAGFVVATRDEIRAREGDAWDGALNEMHDLGWMHDGALADGFARNPYRELIDADVTRDHEEDER
jgi:hypothetical protein